MLRTLLAIMSFALMSACTGVQELVIRRPAPELGFRYGRLLVDGFASGDQWRRYEKDGELFLGLRAGAYRIEFSGRQYVWSQHEVLLEDMVVEADAAQVSDYDHNAFGLACRLDPGNRGRGYFFLISGDGYASIRWSDGRSLEPIVSAAPSEHIRRGQATNRIRVLCIEDYLALWVNGEFVADARDRRASRGAVGLAGVMNYEGRRLAVEFDNLKVWRAALDDG